MGPRPKSSVRCGLCFRTPVGVLRPQSHLFRGTGRTGGKRGPSSGVRIGAKRQRSPLVFSSEQVKLGLAELELRDQLLVFLEVAFGNQGELGALRWLSCDFDTMNINVQLVLLASRLEPEEHKNGSVCKTAADASKPEALLAGVEVAKPLQQTGRSIFPFRKTAMQQAVGSSFSVKEETSA